MPNLDQTGPNGQGPATGRRQGSCGNQGQGQSFFGNNCGRNRGCYQRKGNGGQFFQQENQTLSLDEQEKILENRLETIRKAKESNSNR